MKKENFIKKMKKTLDVYYRFYGGKKIENIDGYEFIDVYDSKSEYLNCGYYSVDLAVYYNEETKSVINRIDCGGYMKKNEDLEFINLKPIYCEVSDLLKNRYLKIVEEIKECQTIDYEDEFIEDEIDKFYNQEV